MTRICDDLRVGGAEIADELFGDPGKARAVYPMKDLLGLFWLNGQLAGFASKMRERLENMPAAAAGENAELEDTEATEVRKNRAALDARAARRRRSKAITKQDRETSDAA